MYFNEVPTCCELKFNITYRGQTRLWTDDEMLDMMDKINRGYTYQDVTDGTHVPISTMWTRYMHIFLKNQCAHITGNSFALLQEAAVFVCVCVDSEHIYSSTVKF